MIAHKSLHDKDGDTWRQALIPFLLDAAKKSREGKSCQTDVKILKESLICITFTLHNAKERVVELRVLVLSISFSR